MSFFGDKPNLDLTNVEYKIVRTSFSNFEIEIINPVDPKEV